MNVGFVGIGRMGDAMVRRLLSMGIRVTAWNRTREKVDPLVALGASVATSLESLPALSDVVLTMVRDDAASSRFTARFSPAPRREKCLPT